MEQQRKQFVTNINRTNVRELNLIHDRYAESLANKVNFETMPSIKVRPPIASELKQLVLSSKLGDPGNRSTFNRSSLESEGSDPKGATNYLSTSSLKKED